MVAPYPVTRVRYDADEGAAVIRAYLSAGHLAPERPPRGVDPVVVRDVILAQAFEHAGMSRVRRALELVRFYEVGEAAPQIARALEAPLADGEDVARACYAIQAVVEPLSPERDLAARAARFFDEVVAEHPRAHDAAAVVFETATVLAPYGTPAAWIARLARDTAEAQRHEGESEAAALAFDRLESRAANEVPRMERDIAEKLRAAAIADHAERARAWVDQYVGRAFVGGVVAVRAARWLRAEAALAEAALVWAAFRAILDEHAPGHARSAPQDLEVTLAGKALLYLGAPLSARHAAVFAERETDTLPFLSDD